MFFLIHVRSTFQLLFDFLLTGFRGFRCGNADLRRLSRFRRLAGSAHREASSRSGTRLAQLLEVQHHVVCVCVFRHGRAEHCTTPGRSSSCCRSIGRQQSERQRGLTAQSSAFPSCSARLGILAGLWRAAGSQSRGLAEGSGSCMARMRGGQPIWGHHPLPSAPAPNADTPLAQSFPSVCLCVSLCLPLPFRRLYL